MCTSFVFLEVVERKAKACTTQPAEDVVVRRSAFAVQFPERFRSEFLRPANVANYPVDGARQRGVVGRKDIVESFGTLGVPAHAWNVGTARHIVITTLKCGI
jgi:hypothetical protein